MHGTIKRVVNDRGFGFIKGEDAQEYFFHRSGLIRVSDFDHLQDGDGVQFEVGVGQKGPRAEQVERQ